MNSIYSNCNWTAYGELECNGQLTPTAAVPRGIDDSDNYSSLNRELSVSVYSPTPTVAPIPMPMPAPQQSPGTGGPFPMLPPPSMMQPHPVASMSQPQIPVANGVRWSSIAKLPKKKVEKYYFQTPQNKYKELVTELGPPTVVHPQAGGFAVWLKPGARKQKYSIFKRIEINDEQVYNEFPYTHNGFLYTYFKIKIPFSQLSQVLSICGDISYDPLKQLLCVRGMSLGYNIALTSLVAHYIANDISWYNIINGDLVKQFMHHKRLMNPRNQQTHLAFLATFKLGGPKSCKKN